MHAFDPKHPHASTEVLGKRFLLKKNNKKTLRAVRFPVETRHTMAEAVLTLPGINRLLKNWVEMDGLK